MRGESIGFAGSHEPYALQTLHCGCVVLSLQRAGGGKGFEDKLKNAAGVRGLGGNGWSDSVEGVKGHSNSHKPLTAVSGLRP